MSTLRTISDIAKAIRDGGTFSIAETLPPVLDLGPYASEGWYIACGGHLSLDLNGHVLTGAQITPDSYSSIRDGVIDFARLKTPAQRNAITLAKTPDGLDKGGVRSIHIGSPNGHGSGAGAVDVTLQNLTITGACDDCLSAVDVDGLKLIGCHIGGSHDLGDDGVSRLDKGALIDHCDYRIEDCTFHGMVRLPRISGGQGRMRGCTIIRNWWDQTELTGTTITVTGNRWVQPTHGSPFDWQRKPIRNEASTIHASGNVLDDVATDDLFWVGHAA